LITSFICCVYKALWEAVVVVMGKW